MPELAEVERNRRRWDAGIGREVLAVRLHRGKRVFRGCDTCALVRTLRDARLDASEARGKHMLFRFAPAGWLGIHLGMSGHLRVEPQIGKRRAGPARHDHLVLEQPGQRLVYSDPRLFGRVRFHAGPDPPAWWGNLPPEVLSAEFTTGRVADFLARHARAPIKAVLLRQECFPGIGNWMADEALWRAEIHPRLRAGALAPAKVARLRREVRAVARGALRSLGEDGGDLPRGWLFHSRWTDGGRCPRTDAPLVRESIGGRTTCWSRGRQRAPSVTR